MQAIAKTQPGVGINLIDAPEPDLRPGAVKVKIERGSVCGTDLHIFNWDGWSSERIHPPRIIGHEFCGTVVAVAEDVSTHQIGDFIASESHIICGHCRQCLAGQGHVCVNTVILGVDVDGGFGEFAVIPAQNARKVPEVVPRAVASMLDALGNGVHTAMAGPIEGQKILITGLGPIGLFAGAICKALGAAEVVGCEISEYRREIGRQLNIDHVLNPMDDGFESKLLEIGGKQFDGTLEMSGHPAMLSHAIEHTRPGGRVSCLGVFAAPHQTVEFNKIVFKGLDVQGIVGRRLWETWDQMTMLLTEKHLDVTPVITHHMPFTEASKVFETMKAGLAGKIVLDFS